jgi:hypothetical protein
MPLSKLVFKPGVNRDQTNYASEGGWYETQWVRFRSGFPEKMGGWQVQNQNSYVGEARSLFTWSTTDGSHLLGVGTNVKIYVLGGTTLHDITPIRATFITPSTDNCVAVISGTKQVTITIAGHGAETGAYVTLTGVTGTGSAIGGIPVSEINGEHEVTVLDANNFYFTVTTAATSTVSSVGGTAIQANFQINPGYAIVTAGYGWGTSTYSRGAWSSGSTVPIYLQARIVFLDKFNDDLVFNILGENIYYWVYSAGFGNRGVLLSSLSGAVAVPQQVTKCLFSSTGHLFALGCTSYDPTALAPNYTGAFDPLMVRWANVDADIGPEPEVWQPTLTNTAGFLRLQEGSEIITGLSTKQELLVWTDTGLTSIQFLGTAEVFGQQLLASNISITGPNTVATANNIVYWMGRDKFYSYSGRVDTLPCTLRQYVFTNINHTQDELFFAGTNAQYNEIIWFYCSANSNTVDRYVVYNYSENIWYYGNLERTAWIDVGTLDYPSAANNGWIYQHENGHDDGQPNGAAPLPITSYIQSADVDIEDGDKFMLVRRVIPDVNFTSSDTINSVTGATIVPEADITVGVRNFPGAAISYINAEGEITSDPIITSTATINQYTNQVFIRARGRQMNFKIASDTVGTQWQLGMPRVDARPDGIKA